MSSEFEVRTSQSVAANGTTAAAALSFRRSVVVTPDILQWVLEGKVYVANVGTLTGTVGFAGTTLATLRPNLAVRVPSGKTIIPIFVQIIYEATGGVLTEAAIRTCSNDVGAGTATANTPINANTAYAGIASACTVHDTYTGDCAAITNGLEVWRFGCTTDLDAAQQGSLSQAIWTPFAGMGIPPVIKGAGSFLVNTATATSSAGFILAAWAEFNTVDAGI